MQIPVCLSERCMSYLTDGYAHARRCSTLPRDPGVVHLQSIDASLVRAHACAVHLCGAMCEPLQGAMRMRRLPGILGRSIPASQYLQTRRDKSGLSMVCVNGSDSQRSNESVCVLRISMKNRFQELRVATSKRHSRRYHSGALRAESLNLQSIKLSRALNLHQLSGYRSKRSFPVSSGASLTDAQ
jgi:hypothetical protein